MNPGRCLAFLLAALTLIACFPASGHAQAVFKSRRSGPFELIYLPMDEGHQQNILKISERSLKSVSNRLGIKYHGRPIRIILTPSDALFAEQYQKLAFHPPPGWALAVAFSSQRTIIIRSHATRPMSVDNFNMTLRHELAHILIALVDEKRVSSKPVPRWLNEGLAMWASGQALQRVQALDLALLAQSGAMPRFAALEEQFPPHAQEVHRAYLQSLSYIQWIEKKAAEKKLTIAHFIKELEQDIALKTALFRVLWVEDPEFEWRYELRSQSSYGEYLLHTVSLWQILALLALVAFARHVYKSHKIRTKLTREDELEEAIWEANYNDGEGLHHYEGEEGA
jgi:hypothetical protein